MSPAVKRFFLLLACNQKLLKLKELRKQGRGVKRVEKAWKKAWNILEAFEETSITLSA